MSAPYVVDWYVCGPTVTLVYSDGDEFVVLKDVFDRAFGPIVSGPKDQIRREYAIYY